MPCCEYHSVAYFLTQELHASKFYAIITIEISEISSIVKSTY